MNLNCRLSLTDEQRNNIKRNITGKDVKALATRAEICELINGLLEAFTSPPRPQREIPDPHACQQCADEGPHTHNCEGITYENQAALDFCSDDCCKRNELLQRRVNRLQHRLDTGR